MTNVLTVSEYSTADVTEAGLAVNELIEESFVPRWINWTMTIWSDGLVILSTYIAAERGNSALGSKYESHAVDPEALEWPSVQPPETFQEQSRALVGTKLASL